MSSVIIKKTTAGRIGIQTAGYPPNTVGGAVFTTIWGDGVADKSAALLAANELGHPIRIKGVIVVGSATTITVPIIDTMEQIFSAGSLVTINNGLPVRPEWFGSGPGTVKAAINALPSTGGVVQLESKTYQSNGWAYGFAGAANGITKTGVKLQGRKMPRLSHDCRSLVGGTIIQGTVLAFADGIEFSNIGVDNGYTVSQTLYGGEAPVGSNDALVLTYPNNAAKDAAEVRKSAKIHNVIGLCYGPATPSHAVLAGEGYVGVDCSGDVVGCYGVHGVVFKCKAVYAASLKAYCNNSDGLIIKSDFQASAVSEDIQIDRVYVNANGPIGHAPYAVANTGMGVMFHAAGNNIARVQIGKVMAFGYPVGVGSVFSGAHHLDDLSIDTVVTDQVGVAGTKIGVQIYAPAGEIDRIRFGSISARNTTVGMQVIYNMGGTIANHLHVDRLEVVNAQNALQIANTAWASVGTLAADNCSGGAMLIMGTPRLSLGVLFRDTATPKIYDSAGLVPSLSNGWTNYGAENDLFGVDLSGGRTCLRGLVKPGNSSTICTLPQWAWPPKNKRYMCQGYNGAAVSMVTVVVTTAGVVQVNEIGGGFANCSTWLSLSGVEYGQQD